MSARFRALCHRFEKSILNIQANEMLIESESIADFRIYFDFWTPTQQNSSFFVIAKEFSDVERD